MKLDPDELKNSMITSISEIKRRFDDEEGDKGSSIDGVTISSNTAISSTTSNTTTSNTTPNTTTPNTITSNTTPPDTTTTNTTAPCRRTVLSLAASTRGGASVAPLPIRSSPEKHSRGPLEDQVVLVG